jgi:hypothetical protein
MSKHLLIAAGLVVISGITLGMGLVSGGGGTGDAAGSTGHVALGAQVIAADRALSPLQPAFAGQGLATNPFTMGKAGEMRTARIPLPPPPPLTLPTLPALPLSER